MTQPFPLDTYRQGIRDVTTSVYETMLDLPLRSAAASTTPGSGSFTAAVYYAGAWKGALLLECSPQQVMDWGARLMSLAPPVSLEDARDGLGELTNVIAGNLKALLPPGVGISLPSVVQGSDYSLRICGGNLTESLCFEDPTGPFRITLVELIASKKG